jgi:hypothetical protein
MMQEVAKFVPVALDCLEAPEPFTLRGRKTGNERRALTPNVDEMRCKPDHETSSKTDGVASVAASITMKCSSTPSTF